MLSRSQEISNHLLAALKIHGSPGVPKNQDARSDFIPRCIVRIDTAYLGIPFLLPLVNRPFQPQR